MQFSLKNVLFIAGVGLCVSLPMAGFAQTATDPEAAMKEINTWYTTKAKEARDNKTPFDSAKMMAERKAKIEAALKDFDIDKTDPAKCLGLAQLYQAVQKNKEALVAVKKFMTSNPEGASKYSAQSMMLSGYQSAGDIDGLATTLGQMTPPTPQMAASLASSTARVYAPAVAAKLGPQAGLDLISKMEALVPFGEMKSDALKTSADSAVANIATGRSAILENAGKKAEAEAVLVEAVKKLGETNRAASSIVSKLKLAKLPGSPAPELAIDRHYGEFSSLASLRGKVVVLDFTADWCIFCKRAYPDMKKLYNELHPKGLEVIGITTYYGYYKDQKGLSPEAEYVANKGHIEEFGLPWPLLFGGRENMTNYGVSGIPHYVVIDREGKIASITVGYNEPLHKQLRASVEKALEKASK